MFYAAFVIHMADENGKQHLQHIAHHNEHNVVQDGILGQMQDLRPEEELKILESYKGAGKQNTDHSS